MAKRDLFKINQLLVIAIITAGILVFITDDQLSFSTFLPTIPGLIAMLIFIRPRGIKRFYFKQSSRIIGILFGILLLFAFLLIPDPNQYANGPWSHKWVRIYCNHSLLFMHLDQAEKGCRPGPESFMSELQTLARYPIYMMILNAIPYTYGPIVGVIIFYLVTKMR